MRCCTTTIVQVSQRGPPVSIQKVAKVSRCSVLKAAVPGVSMRLPTHAPAGELIPEFHSELTLSLKMNSAWCSPFWTKPAAQHVMISNPPSGRAHPAAMARIASDEALAYYFKTGIPDR